jgi:hypothetical protein
MKKKKVFLPEKLCFDVDEEYCVVDIRLDSNIIIRDILLHHGKFIEGKVVGGYDGVVDCYFDFDTNNITNIKIQSSITSSLIVKFVKNKLDIL